MEQWMWVIWLAVFVIALIVEATGTDLISVWFAAGSIVALIISFIPDVSWWIELIVFSVISIASLAVFRPIVHKYLRKDIIRSNVDELVHTKGILSSKIDRMHQGTLKINDVVWTCIAQDDKTVIEEGSEVEVLAIRGNKLIVRICSDNSKGE
ncbi:MAG: NfeD family protein [Bacilli bacterium]